MHNKGNTINKMNELGRFKIPFLFIIDFEMEHFKVIPFDEIDKKEILFNINGLTNTVDENLFNEEIDLTKSPISFEQYSEMFNKVMVNINEGYSYLLNLTCATPIDINLTLKDIFYLSSARYKLYYHDAFVVFSPEIFVQINNGQISSYPMKGTINASIHNAEQIILNDKKEIAEHNTIVDLIRNDLSIVSKNVRVEEFRYVEKLKTSNNNLLQVSSKIVGNIEENWHHNIGNIIFKLLPAGSICGAPKKMTVEKILEIENYKRGYYTGIVGIFDGESLDSGVMIRFIEKTDDGLIFKSGGGITSFSNLESEYNEMIDKVYVPIY